MRIYFDACCLNRPYDDQTQNRIHLETEAIDSILEHCERGDFVWVTSEIVEVQQNPA